MSSGQTSILYQEIDRVAAQLDTSAGQHQNDGNQAAQMVTTLCSPGGPFDVGPASVELQRKMGQLREAMLELVDSEKKLATELRGVSQDAQNKANEFQGDVQNFDFGSLRSDR